MLEQQNLKYTYIPSLSTFTNTCPSMITYVNDGSASLSIPAAAKSIVAGLFIGAPPGSSHKYSWSKFSNIRMKKNIESMQNVL